MGRFEPVIKPLWCRYVWWNEVVNGAYESIGAPALAPLLGTPLFNAYLRLLGCKIGRRSYIGTTLFSEFDLVRLGDDVALNAGVVIQNHLFEDRIMKSSHLTIGNECSVGNMAVILYDTEMKRGAKVGPLSLLMKGECLPEQSDWIGIPTSRESGEDSGLDVVSAEACLPLEQRVQGRMLTRTARGKAESTREAPQVATSPHR
jgi:non-ribosomal peptide synthetase-like protein